MASILELGVNTGKWDSGLKKAKSALDNFIQANGGLQEALGKNSAEITKFVGMMGNMESTAKTMRGRLNDYKSTFEQLTMAYKQLTDEEKKGEIGQTITQSLEQLKGKIADTKQAMEQMNVEMGNTSHQGDATGGVLDNLSSKFGMNITQVGAFGAALGVATAATKVAHDAFFANEEQLDEWGRTIEASSSVYRGFLNALNNGDISGYLSKISSIVQAARDAYDALDELATYNAFNQINVERTRHELSESINDLREGSGSKDNVKKAGDAAINELKTKQQKEQKAYVEAVGKLAAERGVSKKDLLDALGGSYGHYSDLKKIKPTGTRTVFYGGGMFGGGGTYQQAVPRTRQEQLGQALRKINDTELQSLQALGAQAQRTAHEIDGVNRQVIRAMNTRMGGAGSVGGGGGRIGGGRAGGGRTGGGGGRHVETPQEKAEKMVASALENYGKTISIADMMLEAGMDNRETRTKKELQAQERLAQSYAEAYNIFQDPEYKTSFENAAKAYNELADTVKGKREEFDEATNDLIKMSITPITDRLKFLLSENMEDNAKRNGKNLNTGDGGGGDMDKRRGEWKWATNMSNALNGISGGMSQITGGLEELGVKVPEGINKVIAAMQGVSMILTGINTILITIAAVKFLPLFNQGGITRAAGGIFAGHRYSGDNIPVMVNSGELILNRAQQGNLASQLTNTQPVGNGQPYVEGETIWLGMRNFLRRTGQGEIVTSKTR